MEVELAVLPEPISADSVDACLDRSRGSYVNERKQSIKCSAGSAVRFKWKEASWYPRALSVARIGQ